VESFAAKIAALTGAVWPLSRLSGPRCGAEELVDDGFNFRRLMALDDADGSRLDGAEGPSDFLVDQTPTLWSAEADSIREDGAWTEMLSTLDLWPYRSRFEVRLIEGCPGASEEISE